MAHLSHWDILGHGYALSFADCYIEMLHLFVAFLPREHCFIHTIIINERGLSQGFFAYKHYHNLQNACGGI